MTAPGSNGGSDVENDAASEETTGTLTSHLPLDLMEEILCRLPVKHLRQLCCVSESWNSLISRDSKFAKKHLHFSTSNHLRRRHLAVSSMNSSRELLLTHSPISSTAHATQLRFILNNNDVYYNSTTFSTCDGILCFGINKSLALLCNPSIRKFNLLPPLKIPCDRNRTIYTLVYDRFTDNYKIFGLSFFNNNKILNLDTLVNWIQDSPDHHIFYRPPEVNVHILGTDYWRRILDHDIFHGPQIVTSHDGIFVSDTVNWLVHDTYTSSHFIVSLDLENESYGKLLPPLCHLKSKTLVSLGVLRDCLSLLTHSDNFDKFFCVWIMKEHRNEESWIKLLSIPHMRDCGFYTYTKALYISEDNRVWMEFLKKPLRISLVIYDSVNDTFKIPEIQNKIHPHDQMVSIVNVYLESLISPFSQH